MHLTSPQSQPPTSGRRPEKRTRTTDEIIGVVFATSVSSATLWHERLGHIGKQKLKVMSNTPEYHERGFILSEKQIDRLNVCDSCMATKIHKIISHKTVDRTKYLEGQVWHMDLTGRKDTPSLIDGDQKKFQESQLFTTLKLITLTRLINL